MRDSIKVMQIYRAYLEATGTLVELLEGHCKTVAQNSMSEKLKSKYIEFRKHTQKLITDLNDDLHTLIRLDYELKEIEDLEKREKK